MICSGIALAQFADTLLYTVLPQESVAMRFGITVGFTGFILGINRLIRIALNPFIGDLYDRMPRRPLMIIGAAVSALATLIYIIDISESVISGPALMTIGRIVWGIGWGAVSLGSTTMVLDVSTDQDRARLTGLLSLAQAIGTGITSFFCGLLYDKMGLNNVLWFSAAMGIVHVLFWLLFLPETRSVRRNLLMKANASVIMEQPIPAEQPHRYYQSRKIVFKKSLQIGTAIFAIQAVLFGILFSTGIIWMQSFFDKGTMFFGSFVPVATLAGFYSSLRIACGGFGGILCGWMSDHIPSRKTGLIIGLLISFGGTLLLGTRSFPLSFIGAMIGGIMSGFVPSLVYAWVGDSIDPGIKSWSLGLINTMGDVGAGISPIIVMAIIPAVGISTVYSVSGLAFVISLVFICRL